MTPQIFTKSTSIAVKDDYRNVIARIPDAYYDLAMCDIPYGIDVVNMPFLKEKKATVRQKNGTRLNANANKKTYQSSKEWDYVTPPQGYYDEVKRISKEQIIFGVEYVAWIGLGNGRIKWNKGFGEGVSFKKYEMAYCSLIDTEIELNLLWAGMFQAKSLAEPMTQQGNKKLNEKRTHPCYKPIMLYEKLYLDYGFKGMKVIDTYLGSGSNRIAADKFGVGEFLGIEIDDEYFSDQEQRFKDYKSQYQLFV